MEMHWNQDLAIGIDLIDTQHEEIFHRIDELRSAIRAGRAREALFNTVAFLEEYIDEHFSVEERYMRQYDYPGILEHIKEHERFKEDFEGFKTRLAELEAAGEFTSFLEIEMERKLSAWFGEHITTIDKKLGVYLAERMPRAGEREAVRTLKTS
jgi:hemerythrin